MKKFFAEFKEFINQGNVVDMAVGVVIGAAFRAIVDSVVNDLISPIIGIIFKMDFSELVATVNGSEIRYGAFIMAVINFIIIALVLFAFVKAVNKMRARKATEEEEVTTKTCPFCKMEVPVEATRCGHCTSQLPEEAAE